MKLLEAHAVRVLSKNCLQCVHVALSRRRSIVSARRRRMSNIALPQLSLSDNNLVAYVVDCSSVRQDISARCMLVCTNVK